MDEESKPKNNDNTPIKMEADDGKPASNNHEKEPSVENVVSTNGGQMEDDDDARPQATFSYTVENLASLTDSVLSGR